MFATGLPGPSGQFGELPPQVEQEVLRFIAKLRRHQHVASLDIARKTLEIMRSLIAVTKDKEISALLESVRRVGKGLVAAHPHERAIGNMVPSSPPCTPSGVSWPHMRL